MHLNHELVRNSLIFIENNQKYDMDAITMEDIYNGLHQEYSKDEIYYAFKRLDEANYINAKFYGGPSFFVDSITFDGHEFLDNVRDPKVWQATKVALSKLTTASLPIVAQLAIQQVRSFLSL